MQQTLTERITIPVADETAMVAYVARPANHGPHPGIMVFQEIFGINAHIRDVADRFAREGYLAVAPELFHRTAPGFEGTYTDLDPAFAQAQALTESGLEADVRATFDWLRADAGTQADHIASVGFCMGGRVSFMASALLPMQAAISFYGGRIAPDLLGRAGEVQAPILMFWGGLDQHIPAEQHRAVADALRSAGKTFENVEFSQADHGFFCDARASYHPGAARQAWVLALAFLKEYR